MPARFTLALVLLAASLARALPPIDIDENLIFPDEVYLAVLELPPDAAANPETMHRVVLQLEGFLHKSGYTLAHADAKLEAGRIVVSLHEGQVEKVVFRGRLTFQMLRFKLALDLPRDVFNRPYLERQIAELSARLGIDPPTWELVPTQVVRHQGPQVESLGPLGTFKGEALLRPMQQYELHLVFPEREWSTGAGLDIRSTYFDGFELGVNYQGRGLLFANDRWRVGAMGGAGLRRDIPTSSLYVYPSRAFLEAQWYTPPFAKVVRSFAWLRGEGLARQRQDLRLENYFSTASDLSANIQVRPFDLLSLYIGFGVQHFALFGERAPMGDPVIPFHADQRWRTFVQLGVDLVFESGNARWDRRHALFVEGRLWSSIRTIERPTFSEVRLGYQKVFAFGWHDLWLRARGTWLYGDVLYPFEEPLGDALRGVFGDVFVRSVGGARGEFRFSLTRDLYKLGVFTDVAAYGELDRATGNQVPRFGVAFGPGFHALIEGMFQMDLYLSFGLLSTGRFDTGVNAVLIKVF